VFGTYGRRKTNHHIFLCVVVWRTTVSTDCPCYLPTPALLILDKPCNGLVDINRLKVLALIDLLAREGNTTLLSVNHHHEDVIPSIKHHLSMTDFNT